MLECLDLSLCGLSSGREAGKDRSGWGAGVSDVVEMGREWRETLTARSGCVCVCLFKSFEELALQFTGMHNTLKEH